MRSLKFCYLTPNALKIRRKVRNGSVLSENKYELSYRMLTLGSHGIHCEAERKCLCIFIYISYMQCRQKSAERNERILMGTECLKTRFPGSLCVKL